MKKFIELWKNAKTNALMKLGLYVIFFIFVFIFISSLTTNPVEERKITTPMDEFATTINYQYEVNDITVRVTGHVRTILYEDVELLDIPEELEKYIIDINPKKIRELVDLGVLESTNHIDNSNTYLVETSHFRTIVLDIEQDCNYMIKITVFEENEKIVKVILDLSNYFEYEVIMVFEPK